MSVLQKHNTSSDRLNLLFGWSLGLILTQTRLEAQHAQPRYLALHHATPACPPFQSYGQHL